MLSKHSNLVSGIITTVTTFVLENFDDAELKNIGNICKQVFLVFPHYCLGRGLIDMATESGLNSVIGQFGEYPRLEERHDKNAQLNFIDTD